MNKKSQISFVKADARRSKLFIRIILTLNSILFDAAAGMACLHKQFKAVRLTDVLVKYVLH